MLTNASQVVKKPQMRHNMVKWKIVLRNHVGKDGKSQLYLQIFDGKRHRFALGHYVKPALWDPVNQRVKGNDKIAEDINLLLESYRAKITTIMVETRLVGDNVCAAKVIDEFAKPELKKCFLYFMRTEMDKRKIMYGKRQIQQHNVVLTKLYDYTKAELSFADINYDLFNGFHRFLFEKGHGPGTIWNNMKIFKSYVNLAIKKGIRIKPVKYRVEKPESNREFLNTDELKRMMTYYKHPDTPYSHRRVLQYYLFACVTNGARHGDIREINKRKSIIGDNLVYYPQKSKKQNKLVKIPLTPVAKSLMNNEGDLFDHVYSEKETNELLKVIANACGIKKHLTFHTARHTFATQFLISGGSVVLLKEILKHKSIDTTLIYDHLVQQSDAKQKQLNKYSEYLLSSN